MKKEIEREKYIQRERGREIKIEKLLNLERMREKKEREIKREADEEREK